MSRIWLFAASALTFAGASVPVHAESTVSSAFVAHVLPHVAFLADAGRLAQDKSARHEVRALATAETARQATVERVITAWRDANSARERAIFGTPVAQTPTGAIIEVAEKLPDDIGTPVTGRSVATVAASGQPVSAEQADMIRLRTFQGSGFDTLYRLTQRDRLLRLAVLYADYAANGDDAELRNLAVRELPKVKADLASLSDL